MLADFNWKSFYLDDPTMPSGEAKLHHLLMALYEAGRMHITLSSLCWKSIVPLLILTHNHWGLLLQEAHVMHLPLLILWLIFVFGS